MPETVCAVVVTYNRKPLLQECLEALKCQSRPVDHVVVVDNASTDGTCDMVARQFPQVELLKLTQNLGGAGGFHEGVKRAADLQFDWIWLMDDDGRPAPDCLEKLLAHSEGASALVPVQQNARGALYGVGHWRGMDVNATVEIVSGRLPKEGDYIFAFVGPLISREIVNEIGLPNKDFFIWYDDIEYALRIISRPAGRIVVVPEAMFYHEFGGGAKEASFLGRKSLRTNQPAWKTYYSARNPLFIVTRVKRSAADFSRYLRYQLRYAIGDLVYEADRWKRLSFRARGFWDGAFGRMGKRVTP